MDKSRQQFEEEMAKCLGMSVGEIRHHRDGDKYLTLTESVAWVWWQASRESLEVELPDLGDVILDDYFVDGFNDAISEVEKVLISNGVKIKNG